METDRIHELIVYGTVLWPRTFTAPTDDVTLALTVQVWQDVLGDLDPAQVRAAMAAWSGRFPPTSRELRDATLEVARLVAGIAPAPAPDEALAELERAIHLIGYMGRPEWSHPAIGHAVAAVGGWADGICHTSNPSATRAHFIAAYKSAVERGVSQSEPVMPILVRVGAAELEGRGMPALNLGADR